MDKSRYTSFHDTCGQMERRFGRQGRLPLKQNDTSIVRCHKLLDFGAGKGLNSHLCNIYRTLDSDPTLRPSFTTIQEAQASGELFDAIIANQVFEHINLDEMDETVGGLAKLLRPEGVILATLPNVHRGTYYFNDIDHKTPLMYYHLAAFFEMNGLDVIDAYRYAKDNNAIANAAPAMVQLMEFLETMYELDPANFIAVVGKKHAG